MAINLKETSPSTIVHATGKHDNYSSYCQPASNLLVLIPIMRKNRTIFNALFSLILSIFGYSAHAQDADQIWYDTAQKMAAATSPEEMRTILNENLPGFTSGIEKDSAENRELLNLWGTSRNIDESHLTDGTRTVPANVVQFLNSILKVNYDENFVFGHAGLTHTYGYLMSNLTTPFGFKRARYVGGEIETGLGLPVGILSGLPSSGTLLSNLTNFAGEIAFRDRPEMLDLLNSEVPEISNFNYEFLKPTRLIEIIENERYTLELRTDIVPFIHENTKGKNTSLLIYSLNLTMAGQKSQPRLITVFPVEKGFADGVFLPANLGEKKAIKLKYNAALPITIPAEEMIGKRFIADENTKFQYRSSKRKAQL